MRHVAEVTLFVDGIDMYRPDAVGVTQSPFEAIVVNSVPFLPWGLPFWFRRQ